MGAMGTDSSMLLATLCANPDNKNKEERIKCAVDIRKSRNIDPVRIARPVGLFLCRAYILSAVRAESNPVPGNEIREML